MPERAGAEDDRRRFRRFSCGGLAQINLLPSNGILLRAAIRDLSLQGCWVETSLPIGCGARAEIVIRVNSASFRAVGEVRGIHGHSGAGLEFVQLSAGGKDMLSDLITDLAKLQTAMNKLKSVRREVDAESFRKELGDGKYQAAMLGKKLSRKFSGIGTVLPVPGSEDSVETHGPLPSSKNQPAETQSLVITVDFFG